jgi:hypothetical protein
MKTLSPRWISILFAASMVSAAAAQDRQVDQTPPAPQSTVPADARVLTGKERSGRKWNDEQRIDNCNVPAEKRGSKPRPDCLHSPSG